MRLWIRPRRLPVWRRGFPFFFAAPRSAIERLRSAAAAEVWRRGSIPKRIGLVVLMSLTWPLATLALAARLAAKQQPDGHGFMRSFGTLYAAALTRNVPPDHYVRYAPQLSAGCLSDFLLPFDVQALQYLNEKRGCEVADVQDKARFEQICRRYGIACVPTLAAFGCGSGVDDARLRSWAGPLFVKALRGNRGAGAQQWTRSNGAYVSSDGRQLSVDELIAWLRMQDCIVQPVVENCAELLDLGSVALSSVRIVTAKGSSGAKIIAASLSLASEPGALTGHDGIQCGIDIADGTITEVASGSHRRDSNQPLDHRAALRGLRLPFWRESVELVVDAHNRAFSKFVTLGWDVALTDGGPILLETNVNWGTVQHQLLTGPLGRTALAGIIDELIPGEEAALRRQRQ